jgi:pyridoxine/pyridoxamine 5'-phosphate oxidase
LADAGHAHGAGLPPIEILYHNSEILRIVGEAIQQMWHRDLGLEVRLANQEKKTVFANRRAGDYQVLLGSWTADYLDATTYLDMWRSDSGNNHTGWSDPAYDALTDRANTIADRTERAAVLFHWDTLHRQVRMEGPVTRVPEAESDAYFASRPWQSRVGAWASQQSQPVAQRADLKQELEAQARRFGAPVEELGGTGGTRDYAVPRPDHWGGYRLWVEDAELWVEAAFRLHDRVRWQRTLQATDSAGVASFIGGPWRAARLQP